MAWPRAMLVDRDTPVRRWYGRGGIRWCGPAAEDVDAAFLVGGAVDDDDLVLGIVLFDHLRMTRAWRPGLVGQRGRAVCLGEDDDPASSGREAVPRDGREPEPVLHEEVGE